MFRRFLALVVALGWLGAAAAAATTPPPDLPAIRSAVAGTWQSADDPKFTRELAPDGSATDRYEGDAEATTSGRWQVFVGNAPPAGLAGQKFQPGVVYMSLAQNGDMLLFAVVGLSRAELKMVYLARGNLLTFQRLK